MTLAELREIYPRLFYRQDWFNGEPFMDIEAGPPLMLPARMGPHIAPPSHCKHAVDLAVLYCKAPRDPMWKHYIWTCDFDTLGQRVYVGDNGRGLEIHRHLQITDRWRVPLWT